ncbi:MAG: hypothetical protein IKM05_01860 [Clostridia bacterium]|nr:hypothetical protein [Clostridia bacterium]
MANKKNKKPLLFKPYYKGSLWTGGDMIKQGLKVFCYFLFFCIMYAIVGSTLSFDSFVLRLICNGLVLFICASVIFNKGLVQGEDDVGLGEIVYARLDEGKPVEEMEKKKSYRSLRGWLIFLLAIVPVLAVTLPGAIYAEREMYVSQPTPSWVQSFESQDEIYQPLLHQTMRESATGMDVLRLISRLLILPYVGIFTTENKDTLLLLEQLAPLLAILPGIAYPIGYMMGPYARARVHGDIAANKRRQKRRQKKQNAMKNQRNNPVQEKKNELI